MTNPGLSLAFAASAGQGERHWIRVEQVLPDEDVATLADAARLIDSLYKISPCVTSTIGIGGEAGTDEVLPDEDGYFATARTALDLSALCTESEYWEAQVDVFRSHRNQPFRLVSETAQVGSSMVVTERKTERLNLTGANSVDLAWPYQLGLTVSGATVASIRGSTVNFTAPVTGPVTLSYQAIWDRVTVRVPQSATANGTKEAEPASVVAFQGDMAAACDLKQPDPDNSMSASEREKLCTRSSSSHGQIGGDCWQTVEHYSLCNCSGSEAPGTWQETVSVPCPEGVSGGAHTGMRRVLSGYVYCEGEEDEVNDPEFYEKTCCTPPPKSLPRCKRTLAVWSGGAEIEGGADRYRAIYGDNVQLTAVTPEEGCGKKVWEWDTSSRDCCDDITPLSPDPNNPSEFRAGEAHWIGVLDGRPGELIWTARGGLYFWLSGHKIHTLRTSSRWVFVYAESEGVCPEPSIKVDDKCDPLEMTFVGGAANPLELPYDDLVIAPEERFVLQATGGVPPMRWQTGGQIELISWDQETGRSALFEAQDDFCGTADISIIDACGDEATVTIRSTGGHWEEVELSRDGQCEPFIRPRPASYIGQCKQYSGGSLGLFEVATRGRRVLFCAELFSASFDGATSGSCEAAIAKHTPAHNCGTPVEMGYRRDGSSLYYSGGSYGPGPGHGYGRRDIGRLCSHSYSPNSSTWNGQTHHIEQAYRWVCQDGAMGNG